MSTPRASILYVGNSYLSFNNGIGWHVSSLHASTKPARRLRITSAVITGGGLAWHDVESYFRPNAVGSYHPTLAGTYLAACTVYAALFGRGAEKHDGAAGLDAPTAHPLHSIAVDTVTRHRGGPA